MDAATLVWTLILFGGTIVVVAWLMSWAWRVDRKKRPSADEGAGAADSGA